MKKTRRFLVLFCLCVLLLFPALLSAVETSSYGEEIQYSYHCCDEPTEFGIGTYGWLPYLNGEMMIKGNLVELDVSVVDLIKESDSLAVLVARFDVQKGRWSGYADFQYGKLSFKNLRTPVPPLTINMEFKFYLFELAARYRLCERLDGCYCTTVDLIAGGRFSRYDVAMDLSIGPSVGGSIDWVDPIVGVRSLTQLNCCWDLMFAGDVGGFGIGADFYRQVLGGFRYHLCLCNNSFERVLFYRALSQDYQTGSSTGGSSVDMVMHGPLIGLMWTF